jgi:hypothetical protein
MTCHNLETSMTTDQRLARLERQCRLLKAGFALTAITLVTVLLVGAGQDQEKGKVLEEVRAKKFVLVDENRKTRGQLDISEGRSRLTLFSAEKKALAFLSTTAEGSSGLCFLDQEGKPRAVIGYASSDAPKPHQEQAKLELLDKNGIARANLAVLPEGQSLLHFRDRSDVTRAFLCVERDGRPVLGLMDDQGTLRLQLALALGTAPSVRLYDSDATYRAAFEMMGGELPCVSLLNPNQKAAVRLGLALKTDPVKGTGGWMPQIELSDEKKTTRVSLTVDPDEEDPPLTIYDKDGNITFQAPR